MCPSSRSSSTPSTGAPLRAGRCRSSGCAQVPSPHSRHLLPPTTSHAPRPRQRASQRPTTGGGVPRTERPQEHTMTFLVVRRSPGASCVRHPARSSDAPTRNESRLRSRRGVASASRRQWLRSRARLAAEEHPPVVAGSASNVLKHANDLIGYIDKCFAIVSRSAGARVIHVFCSNRGRPKLETRRRLAVDGA